MAFDYPLTKLRPINVNSTMKDGTFKIVFQNSFFKINPRGLMLLSYLLNNILS